jgi:hypothetical protein
VLGSTAVHPDFFVVVDVAVCGLAVPDALAVPDVLAALEAVPVLNVLAVLEAVPVLDVLAALEAVPVLGALAVLEALSVLDVLAVLEALSVLDVLAVLEAWAVDSDLDGSTATQRELDLVDAAGAADFDVVDGSLVLDELFAEAVPKPVGVVDFCVDAVDLPAVVLAEPFTVELVAGFVVTAGSEPNDDDITLVVFVLVEVPVVPLAPCCDCGCGDALTPVELAPFAKKRTVTASLDELTW